MTDEAKGCWVETTAFEFTPSKGGRWRVDYDNGSAGLVVRYWQWEEALPLPDKPGARFWGKCDDGEPQWWFSVQTPSRGRVCFYSQRWDFSEGGGLTRLHDPED